MRARTVATFDRTNVREYLPGMLSHHRRFYFGSITFDGKVYWGRIRKTALGVVTFNGDKLEHGKRIPLISTVHNNLIDHRLQAVRVVLETW